MASKIHSRTVYFTWHHGSNFPPTICKLNSNPCRWDKSSPRDFVARLSDFVAQRDDLGQVYAKAGLLPRLCREKAIWQDLWSLQNEAISLVIMCSKELWLVEKNRAKVKPDSSVAPRWMKTYSESRIELRNLQILKEMLEKSSQFLSSEQPCELGRCLENYRSWKIPSENLWLRST